MTIKKCDNCRHGAKNNETGKLCSMLCRDYGFFEPVGKTHNLLELAEDERYLIVGGNSDKFKLVESSLYREVTSCKGTKWWEQKYPLEYSKEVFIKAEKKEVTKTVTAYCDLLDTGTCVNLSFNKSARSETKRIKLTGEYKVEE